MPRKNFNKVSGGLPLWYGKPAVLFEHLTGIKGISANYKYPRDMTAIQYDFYTDYTAPAQDHYETTGDDLRIVKKSDVPKRLLTRMQGEWKALRDLNAQLGRIGVDTEDGLSLHHAISGVACGLNTDDIDIYIRMQRKTGVASISTFAQSIPGYQALEAEVRQLSPHRTEWFPSPKTLRKIKSQLEAQHKPATRSKYLKKKD